MTAGDENGPQGRADQTPRESIRAGYVWTTDEHREAVRLVYKYGRAHRTRSMVSYVVGALFAYVAIMSFIDGDWILGAAWILAAVVWVAVRPALRMRVATMVQRDPGLDRRVEFKANEAGVRQVVEELGEIDAPWERITEAVVTDRGVLLFRDTRSFFWLPRHAFSSQDDYQSFETLLDAKVKRVRRT